MNIRRPPSPPHFLSSSVVRSSLPPRPLDAHKGKNGHVLFITGSQGMPGAAVLSALGALRAGAGLVTVATVASAQAVVHGWLPEVMTIDRADIDAYIKRRHITTLAIGPGLGMGAAQKLLIKKLLKKNLPTVLDADGLNNLSLKELPHSAPYLIITPHEGELAHLRKETRDALHRRREKAAQDTARAFNGICVLKGRHTLIASTREMKTNPTGNPAMASGGMGDVLTGIIAGFLAQGVEPFQAACVGVYLHGGAADLSAVSDRGLLAHEVANAIPQALASVRSAQ